MTPIDFGGGLIFPSSWADGPPDGPDTVTCPECGEDRYADESPCEHCGERPWTDDDVEYERAQHSQKWEERHGGGL